MITRTHDADAVNAVMSEAFGERMDFSRYCERDGVPVENNYVLIGEHGCMIFGGGKPGTYALIMGITPAGRGAWASSFVENALNYMFTQTDATHLWATVASERRDVIMQAAQATGIEIEHTDKLSFASVSKDRWSAAHAVPA